MSTLKKRAIDAVVGDHLRMFATDTRFAVTKTTLVDATGRVRFDYINRATNLIGWIELHPHEWVVVDEWPYGRKSMHEDCCKLHVGALHCDCKASDASDSEHGRGT